MREKAREYFKSDAYAVVGASKDRNKYGNVVLRTMKGRGINVFPVNPREREIEGLKCFASVNDLPDAVHSIVTVVPPRVTESVVSLCEEKGIRAIWMQPGSESPQAIGKAEKAGITVLYNTCIINFLKPFQSLGEVRKRLM